MWKDVLQLTVDVRIYITRVTSASDISLWQIRIYYCRNRSSCKVNNTTATLQTEILFFLYFVK